MLTCSLAKSTHMGRVLCVSEGAYTEPTHSSCFGQTFHSSYSRRWIGVSLVWERYNGLIQRLAAVGHWLGQTRIQVASAILRWSRMRCVSWNWQINNCLYFCPFVHVEVRGKGFSPSRQLSLEEAQQFMLLWAYQIFWANCRTVVWAHLWRFEVLFSSH